MRRIENSGLRREPLCPIKPRSRGLGSFRLTCGFLWLASRLKAPDRRSKFLGPSFSYEFIVREIWIVCQGPKPAYLKTWRLATAQETERRLTAGAR